MLKLEGNEVHGSKMFMSNEYDVYARFYVKGVPKSFTIQFKEVKINGHEVGTYFADFFDLEEFILKHIDAEWHFHTEGY